MKKASSPENYMVVFNDHTIRRVFHNNEWWFVIVDVIAVLTDSKDPANYLRNMKRRDTELSKGGVKLTPPFLLKQRVVNRNLIVRIRRGYSALSSRSPLLRQNPLSVG
jgi:prophage antirepressor-like protein